MMNFHHNQQDILQARLQADLRIDENLHSRRCLHRTKIIHVGHVTAQKSRGGPESD